MFYSMKDDRLSNLLLTGFVLLLFAAVVFCFYEFLIRLMKLIDQAQTK
jgi:hypothetical protein